MFRVRGLPWIGSIEVGFTQAVSGHSMPGVTGVIVGVNGLCVRKSALPFADVSSVQNGMNAAPAAWPVLMLLNVARMFERSVAALVFGKPAAANTSRKRIVSHAPRLVWTAPINVPSTWMKMDLHVDRLSERADEAVRAIVRGSNVRCRPSTSDGLLEKLPIGKPSTLKSDGPGVSAHASTL